MLNNFNNLTVEIDNRGIEKGCHSSCLENNCILENAFSNNNGSFNQQTKWVNALMSLKPPTASACEFEYSGIFLFLQNSESACILPLACLPNTYNLFSSSPSPQTKSNDTLQLHDGFFYGQHAPAFHPLLNGCCNRRTKLVPRIYGIIRIGERSHTVTNNTHSSKMKKITAPKITWFELIYSSWDKILWK